VVDLRTDEAAACRERESYERMRERVRSSDAYAGRMLAVWLIVAVAWIAGVWLCFDHRSVWPLMAAFPIHILGVVCGVLCEIANKR
jgi:fatty acid desaturase